MLSGVFYYNRQLSRPWILQKKRAVKTANHKSSNTNCKQNEISIKGSLYLIQELMQLNPSINIMEIIKAFIVYLISYTFTYYSIKYSLSDHILISTMNIGISALVAASVTAFLSADLIKRKKNEI